MALNATMLTELETLRDMKRDLNETCLISEDRMIAAEKAYSVLKKQHETDAEVYGKQVSSNFSKGTMCYGIVIAFLCGLFAFSLSLVY